MTDRIELDVDERIVSLAAEQHGVVARRQLLGLGIPAHAVAYRVHRRRLILLHRGVYRLGPVRDRLEREMAAVLACGGWAESDGGRLPEIERAGPRQGPGCRPWEVMRRGSRTVVRRDPVEAERARSPALLSGGRAGLLWRFRLATDQGEDIDVGVLGPLRAPARGIRVHRLIRLRADERTVFEGLPITTPARTILELAGRLGSREIERVLAHAEREEIVTPGDVARLVARHPTRAGTRALRDLLGSEGGPAFTRSEAEDRMLALIRGAGIPEPETNRKAVGIEVDFLWRAAKLIVEVDGFRYHGSPAAFERDRRRDAALIAAGFRVVHVTWRQIVDDAPGVIFRLGQAFGASPTPAP